MVLLNQCYILKILKLSILIFENFLEYTFIATIFKNLTQKTCNREELYWTFGYKSSMWARIRGENRCKLQT